jgi:hypothetical protein
MKIDTEQFLTIEQTAEELGAPNKRAVYRAIGRARAAGHETTASVFGKTLIPRAALAVLKDYYYPYYSEAHQANVKKWGAAGGTQKRINQELGVRSTRRRST